MVFRVLDYLIEITLRLSNFSLTLSWTTWELGYEYVLPSSQEDIMK